MNREHWTSTVYYSIKQISRPKMDIIALVPLKDCNENVLF